MRQYDHCSLFCFLQEFCKVWAKLQNLLFLCLIGKVISVGALRAIMTERPKGCLKGWQWIYVLSPVPDQVPYCPCAECPLKTRAVADAMWLVLNECFSCVWLKTREWLVGKPRQVLWVPRVHGLLLEDLGCYPNSVTFSSSELNRTSISLSANRDESSYLLWVVIKIMHAQNVYEYIFLFSFNNASDWWK